jgi:hypothetical protein
MISRNVLVLCAMTGALALACAPAAAADDAAPKAPAVAAAQAPPPPVALGKDAISLAAPDAWRQPRGEWAAVGEAVKDPANEKALSTKPGPGILVNGPKGRTGNLFSAREFGDAEVHVEFMIPKGSNSGVYFQGRYEIQVYDSFGVVKDAYPGIECGGIYERWDAARGPGKEGFEGHSPAVNASAAPGEWQSFDVVFRAPRFDSSGAKTANARFVSVRHNGVLVHENVEVTGPTRGAAFGDEKPAGPLMLQGDHGPVAYRNIRVLSSAADAK